MKLYSEEQVRTILDLAKLNVYGTKIYSKDELIEQQKPIELPSDEEIEQYATFMFPDAEKIGGETYTAYRGMKSGAKWMKEQIIK